MSTFAAKEEWVQLWKRMLLTLEMNSFKAKDERGERVYAGDKITRLELRTNTFSSDDGTRMMLKANLFGAEDEPTHLAIDTNRFGIGDEP